MPKSSVIFVCSECQYKIPRWQGKCSGCGQWNTLQEHKAVSGRKSTGIASEPVDLGSVDATQRPRIKTGINEFDDVVGGGIVPGSLVLLGGDPGIGKSTLALQLSMQTDAEVVYVSGKNR